MIGRSALIAWAKGEPSDIDPARAILAAEQAAADDSEGRDPHSVFVSALLAELGLKRPVGNIRIERFDADLTKFRLKEGRSFSHGEIVRALDGLMKQSTVRNRLRVIDTRRLNRAGYLASERADEVRERLGLNGSTD